MILYLNSLSDINTHLLVLQVVVLICAQRKGLNRCGGIAVLTPQLYAALTVHTTTTSSVNTTTTSSVDTTIIVDC